MLKRLSTAAIGIVLAAQAMPASANPYYGYDGRNYGEFQKAPNFGRPAGAPHSAGGVVARKAGTGSRKGLTKAALALLERIETQFGGVNVISGYRPGARIAGSGRVSRHASGNAIDFEAGSRKGAIIKWLVANHKSGGTMTYADMSHIHVDIGPHFVSLRGGSGRSYASNTRSRSRDYGNARYAQRAYSNERTYARSRGYGYGSERRRSREVYAYAHASPMQHYNRGYAAMYQQ
jgi:hypothetical protein